MHLAKQGWNTGATDGFDAVAIGASAGGVTALQTVIGALPREFPAAVLVVQHLDPRHKSLLAELLARRTPLVVTEAVDRALIQAGTVFIAPPDNHLLVANRINCLPVVDGSGRVRGILTTTDLLKAFRGVLEQAAG